MDCFRRIHYFLNLLKKKLNLSLLFKYHNEWIQHSSSDQLDFFNEFRRFLTNRFFFDKLLIFFRLLQILRRNFHILFQTIFDSRRYKLSKTIDTIMEHFKTNFHYCEFQDREVDALRFRIVTEIYRVVSQQFSMFYQKERTYFFQIFAHGSMGKLYNDDLTRFIYSFTLPEIPTISLAYSSFLN